MTWTAIPTCCVIERLVFDYSSRWLVSPRARVELTPKESDVLLHLVGCAGRWVSTRELATYVWRHASTARSACYSHVVRSLRAKLRFACGGAKVESSRTLGYRLLATTGKTARMELVRTDREKGFGFEPTSPMDNDLPTRHAVAGGDHRQGKRSEVKLTGSLQSPES